MDGGFNGSVQSEEAMNPLLELKQTLRDAEEGTKRLSWKLSPLPERTLEFWQSGRAEPYTVDEETWNDFFPNTHSAICAHDGSWTFYERDK